VGVAVRVICQGCCVKGIDGSLLAFARLLDVAEAGRSWYGWVQCRLYPRTDGAGSVVFDDVVEIRSIAAAFVPWCCDGGVDAELALIGDGA
jgi:hypothetical protein